MCATIQTLYKVNDEHVDSYVKYRAKDKVWTDHMLSTYGCIVCLIVIRRARSRRSIFLELHKYNVDTHNMYPHSPYEHTYANPTPMST
jgi:hypothetical protein